MKFLITLLLLAMSTGGNDTDYSRMTDLQLDGLKGNVRSEETRENNRAVFTNGKWVLGDTGIVASIFNYDRKGYITSTTELLRGEPTIQANSWKDEDWLYNWLITDKDNAGKTELAVREFNDDTTLLIKIYKTDEDTVIYEQLEEEVRTYTAYGCRREYFSVKKDSRHRYLYYEKRSIAPDTFSINYYGESSARLVHAILERDGTGNPTKILVCTDEDTTLTVKKYSYY